MEGENIMKQSIEYLKQDRKVNSAFIKKVESIGLEVEYGTYSYWQGQPYVQIGRKKVWFVAEKCGNGSSYIDNRYQNNVIDDIIEAITDEKAKAEKADKLVEEFFAKLSK
jgi:hypothetical protein